MNWVLAIDSAGSALSLAALAFGRDAAPRRFSLSREGAHGHDEAMGNLLEELLIVSKCSLSQVAAIVIGEGPGSFTGLRIGFSLAKGISFARKTPLLLLPSALGAACNVLQGTPDLKRVSVFASGGKNQFFLSQIESSHPDILMGNSTLLTSEELTAAFNLTASPATFADLLGCPVSIDAALPASFPQLAFQSAGEIAAGLLEVASRRASVLNLGSLAANWKGLIASLPYELNALSQAGPNYVREAAAKTIEQRQRDKSC